MKKSLNPKIIILAAIILITAFFVFFIITQKETKYSIDQNIQKASDYLMAQIKPDGSFVYRVHMDPKQKLKRKYNILRHMGALYSLNMMERYKPGSIHKSKIKKSIKYILDQSLRPAGKDMLGVWSSSKLSGTPFMQDQVKLGAIGLTLVTLCDSFEFIKDIVTLEQLKKLGDFAIYMQKEDGGFYSKYFKTTGREDKWTSLYYPGEAAFGLVELYKLTNEKKYLNAAIKAIVFLYNERKDLPDAKIPADHWALIASDKILATAKDINPEVKTKILKHAESVVRSILVGQINTHDIEAVKGGFTDWGRPTPTSTRIEGLTAIYPHLTTKMLKELTWNSIEKAIVFTRNAQIVSGKYAGAWPRSILKLNSKKKTKKIKNFNRRAREIRIDYVQHALSALISYQTIKRTYKL